VLFKYNYRQIFFAGRGGLACYGEQGLKAIEVYGIAIFAVHEAKI
jgi:hypothetical protein